jgi:hypothetical protein
MVDDAHDETNINGCDVHVDEDDDDDDDDDDHHHHHHDCDDQVEVVAGSS